MLTTDLGYVRADRPSWRAVILFLGSLAFTGTAAFLLATA